MNIIQEFTEAYQVTDAEAAKILGVSKSAVSQWRCGKVGIPIYICRSIMLHLDIPKSHQKRIKEKSL